MAQYTFKKTKRIEAEFEDTEFGPYLQSFRVECQLRNLSDKTVEVYFEHLAVLFRYAQQRRIKLGEITRLIIQQYIMFTRDKVAVATTNGRLRAFRRFWNFLAEEKLWEGVSPMKGIKMLKAPKLIKPVVEPSVLQAVLRSANTKTFEGCRDQLMILLFWDGMLRKKELLGLKVSDVDLKARLMRVYGKGSKERMVPLGVKTLRAINHHLGKWRCKYPGEHLICMRNGDPVDERRCHKIVQQFGHRQGVRLYPHLIRHSAATWYIQQGGNPVVLQGILGHSSLLVTQQYLHLNIKDAVESYQKLSPANSLRF